MMNNSSRESIIPPPVLSQLSSPVQSQTPPTPPQKKSFKWPFILIILLFSSTSIFAYQYYKLKNQAYQPQPTPSPSITTNHEPTPTPDPTANWKTYINTQIGFSLKHPAEYLEEEIKDLGPNDKRVIFKNSTDNNINFSVSTSPAKIPQYPFDQKPTGNYTLDDYQGIYLELPNGYPDGGDSNPSPFLVVYIQKTSLLYQIKFFGTNSLSDKLVSQILSTFKFTDSNSENDQIKSKATDYLVLKGHDRNQLKIGQIVKLGNLPDKYSVGYIPDSSYVGGGVYLLIGKVNGEWIIPESGDSIYCNWVKTAGLDEATIAFMGPTCQ